MRLFSKELAITETSLVVETHLGQNREQHHIFKALLYFNRVISAARDKSTDREQTAYQVHRCWRLSWECLTSYYSAHHHTRCSQAAQQANTVFYKMHNADLVPFIRHLLSASPTFSPEKAVKLLISELGVPEMLTDILRGHLPQSSRFYS